MRPSELEEARLGFNQYLRRKHFSPQFIARHGEDLFATATLEYSRKIAEGAEIEHPAGWLITCAWQRTKSLLEAEARSPRVVSSERAGALGDELGQSPEDAALEEDRFRKVQEAIDQLSLNERRLLELSYFEGMAVREAARALHWHPSKAQRCHEAARRRLHDLLGVQSLDELELDIGLAAFLSLIGAGSTTHLPAGVEAAIELTGRGASYAWARAQDLARRLPLGSGAEPSTAALSGSAGRAAGVCATAALACLASGVVGPGVGGVIGGGGGASAPAPKQRNVADTPRVTPPTPRTVRAPSPPPEMKSRLANGNKQRRKGGSTAASAERTKHATEAVASQSLESAAGGSETSSAPVESAPAAESSPTPSESSASSSSSTPTQVANQQFGP